MNAMNDAVTTGRVRRSRTLASAVTVAAAGALLQAFFPATGHAQIVSPYAGVWTLNRPLSELPKEIGFNLNWLPAQGDAGQNTGSAGGGGGRRGSAGGGGGRGAAGQPFTTRESYEDSRRLQLITTEARNPPARLMVVDTPAAITITNELGQSRVLHPDGREESIELQGVAFPVTTRREPDRLVVVYHVEQDRDVRYTYSHSATPTSQLVVEVQFLEHNAGDKAKLVYEPGAATETVSSGAPGPPSAPPAIPAVPSSSKPQAPDTFDQRPGAELKGLKSLGILVEDLSTQAVACGLNHDALETALSKRLTDAGFSVRTNSDEDTYLYVNVMTNSLSNGTCVSRYDAFLYTQATANLSYHDRPVLVQVSLMHRGGIGNTATAAHAATVTRGLENYVDLIVTQIRDANK